MFKSWRIGTLSGITVNVHGTFLLLLGFIVISGLVSGGAGYAALELITLLTVFGVVVLHEFGHAMAARHFGIGTRDITLYPIGGVARLERMPERPLQELAIAVAGPAVNIALALLSLVVLTIPMNQMATFVLQRFLTVNIALAVFNLLPAFPMDGGRVLRAFLAMKHEYLKATQIAAKVGRFMAVGLGILALVVGYPMLAVIAVFIWIAGSSEERAVQARHAYRQSPLYWFVNTPREDWWRWRGMQGGRQGRKDASFVIVDE